MGPYLSSSVMGALPLIEAGSEDQRRQILPRVASGELLLALALTEPSARWDAEGVQMEARREGSEYALSGKKLFVADAQVSGQPGGGGPHLTRGRAGRWDHAVPAPGPLPGHRHPGAEYRRGR